MLLLADGDPVAAVAQQLCLVAGTRYGGPGPDYSVLF
jgi:hypothetical protein